MSSTRRQSVISGEEEGVYGWLSVNHLLYGDHLMEKGPSDEQGDIRDIRGPVGCQLSAVSSGRQRPAACACSCRRASGLASSA